MAKAEGFKAQRVFLGDNFDQKTADHLCGRIIELARRSSQKIVLLINSTGGEVDAGLDLYGTIRACAAPVTEIAFGKCESMAVTVLQACHERETISYTRFFLHFAVMQFEHTLFDSDDDVRRHFEARLKAARCGQGVSQEIIARRTGKTTDEVREAMRLGDLLNKEMSPEEALAFGLIDRIRPDKPII